MLAASLFALSNGNAVTLAGVRLEVIWLLGRFASDDKVIADFRKDNGAAIKKVCVRFVERCRQMGPLTKRRHRRLQVQGREQPR